MAYKTMTTQKLLDLALGSSDHFYEVHNGERTVSVFMADTGVSHWAVDRKKATEDEVTAILAQWHVEGVMIYD